MILHICKIDDGKSCLDNAAARVAWQRAQQHSSPQTKCAQHELQADSKAGSCCEEDSLLAQYPKLQQRHGHQQLVLPAQPRCADLRRPSSRSRPSYDPQKACSHHLIQRHSTTVKYSYLNQVSRLVLVRLGGCKLLWQTAESPCSCRAMNRFTGASTVSPRTCHREALQCESPAGAHDIACTTCGRRLLLRALLQGAGIHQRRL